MYSAISTLIIVAVSIALITGLILYIEGLTARVVGQARIKILYGELRIIIDQDKAILYIRIRNMGSGNATIYGYRLTLHGQTLTEYFSPKIILGPGETIEQNIDLTELLGKQLPSLSEEFTITLFLEDGTAVHYRGAVTAMRLQ